MKFITRRTSETGQKFVAIEERGKEAHRAICKLSDQIGFTEWRTGFWCAFGGISAVLFPKDFVVDEKTWKNVNNSKDEWMPRLSTKEGKRIMALFDDLPKVMNSELNDCIDFFTHFRSIGFSGNNDEFIGFSVKEEWKVQIPEDCEEVTVSKYKELFETENVEM